jgi:hypothetical protein
MIRVWSQRHKKIINRLVFEMEKCCVFCKETTLCSGFSVNLTVARLDKKLAECYGTPSSF